MGGEVLACMAGVALGILSAVRQGWADRCSAAPPTQLISIPI